MNDVDMHKRHYDLAKRWQIKEILPQDGGSSFGDYLSDIMGGEDDNDADQSSANGKVASSVSNHSFGAVTDDTTNAQDDSSQGESAQDTNAQDTGAQDTTTTDAGDESVSSPAANSQSSKASTSPGQKQNLGSITVPLKIWQDENGNEREVQAYMGIGGKKFLLTQDTGSVTPWIKKTALDKQGAKSKDTGKHFEVQYGIGSVSGSLHSGTVSADKLSVSHIRIGAASKLSKDLQSDPAQGLMGYAFKELSQSKSATFLDGAFSQNTFDKPQLCFAVGRSTDGTLSKSSMRFGGPDPATVKGTMSWYPISKVGYWQLAVETLAPNGGTGSGVTHDAVVDTGTSIIPVGKEGAKAFFKDIKGAKYDSTNQVYTYPCSTKLNAVLKLKDGKKVPIREEDLNLGKVDTGSSQCVASIVPLDTGGVTVLGLPFLRSSIACLDHDAQKIGLAEPAF